MTQQGFIDIILSRPACQAWEASNASKKQAAGSAVDMAMAQILVAHDFPFTMDEATETGVGDQATYTLKGNHSDCREVIRIRWGSKSTLLTRLTKKEYYEMISGRSTVPSTVNVWVQIGVDNGFPEITVDGTPAEDGDTIYYEYRLSQMKIARFPEIWSWVVVAMAEAELFGTSGMASTERHFRTANPILFTRKGKDALLNMIDDYTRKGGQESPAPISNWWKRKNQRRSKLGGY